MNDKTQVVIVGITKNEYPKFYTALEKVMPLYNMSKINVVNPKKVNITSIDLFEKLRIPEYFLNELNGEETKAVVAHELSHISNHDSLKSICSILFFGVIIGVSLLRLVGLVLSVFITLFLIISVLNIVRPFFKQEFRADKDAVSRTKNKCAMAYALKKHDSLCNKRETDEGRWSLLEMLNQFVSKFIITHPTTEERITHLKLIKL